VLVEADHLDEAREVLAALERDEGTDLPGS
jgi:hypothetical protein